MPDTNDEVVIETWTITRADETAEIRLCKDDEVVIVGAFDIEDSLSSPNGRQTILGQLIPRFEAEAWTVSQPTFGDPS